MRLTARAWTILVLLLVLWLYGAWHTRSVDSDTGTPRSSAVPAVGEEVGAADTSPRVGAREAAGGFAAAGAPPAARASRTSRTRSTLNWAALAQCESSGNPRAVSPSGKYRGLYQFDLPTWRSVGGTGDPADASPAEQTRRAQRLYAARGAQPWPHCGRYL